MSLGDFLSLRQRRPLPLATLAHPKKYIFHHEFMSPKNVLGFSPPATHVL